MTHPDGEGTGHKRSDRAGFRACFLHVVRARTTPISDVHSHMRALNICHLAGISARLDRKINWDAETDRIVGDDQADVMLARPYRCSFDLEGI
ncbi:MAG: hypothetical protein AAGJ97_06710 [Planctomycetota bacterium]